MSDDTRDDSAEERAEARTTAIDPTAQTEPATPALEPDDDGLWGAPTTVTSTPDLPTGVELDIDIDIDIDVQTQAEEPWAGATRPDMAPEPVSEDHETQPPRFSEAATAAVARTQPAVEPEDWEDPTRQEEYSLPPAAESEDDRATKLVGALPPPEPIAAGATEPIRLRPTAPMPSAAGGEQLDSDVGELVLGERIGRGGMAEVFSAERRGPGGFAQKVVVKRMLPAFAEDETFVKRFAREATLAAKLRHPNVIEILELGTHQDEYYIVMEFLDGLNIAAVVRKVRDAGLPVQPGIIANIGARVADALNYAHTFLDVDGSRHRVVHRDVSPENVMLTRDGRVKLLDFGVAKDLDVEGLTVAGDVVGKPLYLPPEAYGGSDPTPAWDIYALGVVLYQLLAAKPPYEMRAGPAGLIELIEEIMRVEPPRLDEIEENVPSPLADIVAKAIAGSTSRRYETAAELRDDLEAFVSSLPAYAPTDPASMLREIGEADAVTKDTAPPPWKPPAARDAEPKPKPPRIESVPARRYDDDSDDQHRPRGVPWPLVLLAFVLVAVGAGGAGFWWATRSQQQKPAPLPPIIAEPVPEPPAAPTHGTVAVKCRSWGYVYLDGEFMGMCPPKPADAMPGKHTVVLKGRGKAKRRKVEVVAGEESLADFTVAPGRRTFTIRPGQ